MCFLFLGRLLQSLNACVCLVLGLIGPHSLPPRPAYRLRYLARFELILRINYRRSLLVLLRQSGILCIGSNGILFVGFNSLSVFLPSDFIGFAGILD